MRSIIYEYGAALASAFSVSLFLTMILKMLGEGSSGIISSFIVYVTNLSV